MTTDNKSVELSTINGQKGKDMTIDLGFYGKITANKALLNRLSLSLTHAEQLMRMKGMNASAGEYEEMARKIFEALEEDGYYK